MSPPVVPRPPHDPYHALRFAAFRWYLLGGMLGWPGSAWAENTPHAAPPCEAEWQELNAEVRHTFTHFHLILKVMTATMASDHTAETGLFVDQTDFRPSDLPTVMRKAFDLRNGAERHL